MRFFRILGLLLLVSACTLEKQNTDDQGETKPVESILQFNESSVTVSDEKAEIRIPLKTDLSFSVSVDSDWLQYQRSESTSDLLNHLVFLISANDSYDQRVAQVKVTAKDSDKTAEIQLIQKQRNAILVTQSAYEVPSSGDELVLEVKSNVDYKVVLQDRISDWVEIVSTKGLSDHQVILQVSENDDVNSRSGVVTFKSGDLSEDIIISQQGAEPSLVLGATRFDIGADGGSIRVPITSNIEYEIIMPEVDWIMNSSSVKSSVTNVQEFYVIENVEYESREAEIGFMSLNGKIYEAVIVSQSQRDAIILGTGVYQVEKEGGRIEVHIEANVDYKAEVEAAATGWLQIEPATKGLVSSTIIVNVSPNEDPGSRTGIIIVQGNGQTVEVTVNQKGNNVLVLSPLEMTFDASEADFEVEVSSNMTFEILLPDGDWVSINPETKSVTVSKISFHLSANESFEAREGDIYFYNNDYGVTECIHLIQSGKPKEITINIETPGTLSSLIDIKELRTYDHIILTGTANDADMDVFDNGYKVTYGQNGYWHTKVLDLSGLQIVSKKISSIIGLDCLERLILPEDIVELNGVMQCPVLSEVVFGENSTLSVISHNSVFNGLNSLLAGAFYQCNMLKKITLPASIEQIEGGAFRESGIEEVIFPDPCKIKMISSTPVFHSSLPGSTHGTYTYSGIFSGCSKLKTVQLPSSIKVIEDYAFAEWDGLETLTIPASAETIGVNGLFNGCSSLKSVSFPTPPSVIGDYFFSGCASLETVPDWDISKIGKRAFSGCLSLEEIPMDNVMEIGEGAFARCGIKSVRLPDSMEVVPDYLFSQCPKLESVDFNNARVIGSHAFYLCGALAKITIPESVCEIGAYAFFYGSSDAEDYGGLKEVTIRSTEIKLASSAFHVENRSGNNMLERFVIGREVKSITQFDYNSDSIFARDFTNIEFEAGSSCEEFGICQSLKIADISLPESVKKLSYLAFGNCSNLSDASVAHILEHVEEIGESAFAYCSFRKLAFPKSIRKIGERAFANCKNLQEIVFPEALEIVGTRAFSGCGKLYEVSAFFGKNLVLKSEIFEDCSHVTSLSFSESLESLEIYYPGRLITALIFPEQSNLHTITGMLGSGSTTNYTTFNGEVRNLNQYLTQCVLPQSLRTVGDYVFTGLNSLENFAIPEGIETIGKAAFAGTPLTSVYLPKVKSLGDYAFGKCMQVQEWNIPSRDLQSIGKDVFLRCNNKIKVGFDIPNSEIWPGCFYYSNFSEIELLEGVEYIGDLAFAKYSEGTTGDWLKTNNVTTFPRTLKHVGNSAFSNNTNITCFDFPNISYIGESAFKNCVNMEGSVDVAMCDYIGSRAFTSCTSVSEWVVSCAALGSDSSSIFSNCNGILTLVDNVIPSLYKYLSNSFSEIRVKEGVTSLGEKAFYNMSVKEYHLPSTLLSIGDKALNVYKDAAANVYCAALTPPSLVIGRGFGAGIDAFYVPESSVEAYKQAWPEVSDKIQPYSFE